MIKHLIVLGTRPELIKISPYIRLLKIKNEKFDIIDTGQHYDYEMSDIFYRELDIPSPRIKFQLPKNNPNSQIGFILTELLNSIPTLNPDVIYAQGDTNTVLATALASQRLLIPFVHIEAGIRSFDNTMPEEINRRVASICASIHCCPTSLSAKYLLMEGVDPKRIFITGNTIIDSLNYFLKNKAEFLKKYEEFSKLLNQEFYLLTLHRPLTVDNKNTLEKVLLAINKLGKKVLFLIHPRTSSRIEEFNLNHLIQNNNFVIEKPVGYFEFLILLEKCSGIITDSGGIQEESTTMNKVCAVIRPNTERPEAIISGFSKMINPLDNEFEKKLIDYFKKSKKASHSINNPFGDGKASERILDIVKSTIQEHSIKFIPPDYTSGYIDINYIKNEAIDKIDEIKLSFDENGELIIDKNEMKNGKHIIGYIIRKFT